jgi:hypothetical protein
MSDVKFSLPEVSKPTRIQPKSILIYSAVKTGKSTICAQLSLEGNRLVISTDPDGYANLEARYQQCDTAEDFERYIKLLEEHDVKLDYLIIDSVSRIDEFSETVGTYKYMKSSMGSGFNSEKNKDGLPTGKKLLHNDPRWEKVITLPNGAGYFYTREIMVSWFNRLNRLCNQLILVAHIKDTKIETKLGDVIDASTIDLTGKVKSIYSSLVDGVALLTTEENDRYLSFETRQGNLISGCRYDYLSGQKILISTKSSDNTVTTYWENIFPSLSE